MLCDIAIIGGMAFFDVFVCACLRFLGVLMHLPVHIRKCLNKICSHGNA